MVISRYPSEVTLPAAEQPYPTILDFLSARFPSVPREVWAHRMNSGKVLDERELPVRPDTGYAPGNKIRYFREVTSEPSIPFSESILFHDDELLAACKPPFLPVTPGGRYVNECLLYRLRARTGLDEMAPLHRIDRDTAGVVLFSVNRATRDRYSELFRKGAVEKTYEALATCDPAGGETAWDVATRIVPGEPWFRMTTASGPANARSRIALVATREELARFELRPITGKTHQLRLHMSGLGFGILHDRLYPELQPEAPDDFDRPLQLIARRVRFRDPVRGVMREFVSERELLW